MGFRGVLSAVVTAILLCAASPTPANAVTDSTKALAQKKAVHKRLKKKSTALSSEVRHLKKELVKTAGALRQAEKELMQTEHKLSDLQEKKILYTENLHREYRALGGLSAAARQYTKAPPPLLFLTASPLQAARTAHLIKSMVPGINMRTTYLRKKLTSLAQIEDHIDGAHREQKKKKDELHRENAKLDALLQNRKKSYDKTEKDRGRLHKEVAALARKAKNLDDLVSKIQPIRKPLSRKTAALPKDIPFPVHGRILIRFNEKDELGGKSKGITFATPPGSPVLSPLTGTVKFAGAFQKFRHILIIEHTGGYHSLITGLGRIDTVVGAALAAGEPVGRTENSGTDTRVYYELRQNGTPVNPQKILVAKRKQDRS